jgi:hypothetical protein
LWFTARDVNSLDNADADVTVVREAILTTNRLAMMPIQKPSPRHAHEKSIDVD